ETTAEEAEEAEVVVAVVAVVALVPNVLSARAVARIVIMPDDGKDTKSCETSSKFPTCTSTFEVTKTVYPDESSTKTTTQTTTSCYTITACTGSSSTTSTTTTTTTTIGYECDQACNGVCTLAAKKRGLAPTDTGMPLPSPRRSSFSDSIRYLDQDVLQSEVFSISDYSGSEVNLTRHMVKRDVPPEGTDPDRDDFYKALAGTATHLKIDNNAFGETAILAGTPNGQDIQLMLEGLQGCLGIFIVSHNGFFMSHTWEKSTMLDNAQADRLFQSDAIDLLANLLGQGWDSALYGDAKVFVMAATVSLENSMDADPSSLFNSQDSHSHAVKVDTVIKLLKEKFNQDPVVFNYKRQIIEITRGAWGKAAMLYSPDHSGSAIWQVYLQGKKYEYIFPNVELQVWRLHADGGASGFGAVNVIQTVKVGTVIDACNHELGDDKAHAGVTASEQVKKGSTNIDVGVTAVDGATTSPQTFRIVDTNDESKILYDNCVFKGSGEYKPVGEGTQAGYGFVAGTVTCDGGFTRRCSRPKTLVATTCGGPSPSSCGTLGETCDRFYQQLAVCRI
ncbi:hypothetical protein PSPO01_05469, partial [Paraphaeosphaeria sporulosa]